MNTASTKIKDQGSVYLEKVAKDFEDLFSGKREGHMIDYVYEDTKNYYDKLIKDTDSYYIMKEDSSVIRDSAEEIKKLLKESLHFVELGPGYEYIVRQKTVQLLRQFDDIKSYEAVDMQIKFAEEASNCISNTFPNINTMQHQADFTLPASFSSHKEKICLLFWGSTFSNFSDSEISRFVQNVSKPLKKGDFFIFSLDCCQDLDKIKNAYNSECFQLMIKEIFYYFKSTFGLRYFDPTKFEPEYRWNEKTRAVNLYLRSTEEQSFPFCGKIIKVQKNTSYFLLQSRKFSEDWATKMFANEGFRCIKEFKPQEGSINIYVAQKI